MKILTKIALGKIRPFEIDELPNPGSMIELVTELGVTTYVVKDVRRALSEGNPREIPLCELRTIPGQRTRHRDPNDPVDSARIVSEAP